MKIDNKTNLKNAQKQPSNHGPFGQVNCVVRFNKVISVLNDLGLEYEYDNSNNLIVKNIKEDYPVKSESNQCGCAFEKYISWSRFYSTESHFT